MSDVTKQIEEICKDMAYLTGNGYVDVPKKKKQELLTLVTQAQKEGADYEYRKGYLEGQKVVADRQKDIKTNIKLLQKEAVEGFELAIPCKGELCRWCGGKGTCGSLSLSLIHKRAKQYLSSLEDCKMGMECECDDCKDQYLQDTGMER